MKRRDIVLAVAFGLTGVGLGVGATRLAGWGPPAAPTPAASSEVLARLQIPGPDAGMRLVMPASDGEIVDAGVRILFDPDSITLLPDASLRLDLPKDAGEP